MNKSNTVAIVCLVLAVALVGASFLGTSPMVLGAPAAAPTPVSVTQPVAGATPKVVTWFNNQTITADTTSPCIDLSPYNLADIYTDINQTATNTTTLTLRFGNSASALVDGVNVVSSNTSDAAALQPFELFGVCTAILANVSNSTPVAITVNAKVQ